MRFSGWTPVDMVTSIRNADLEAIGYGRPEGLHLGDIIHYAKVAAGENVSEIPGDQPYVRMAEGFWFETVIEYVMGGCQFDEAVSLTFKRWGLSLRPLAKQINLERDGIHMTPDAMDASVPELISFKSTRRTLRNARTQDDFESHFWTWVMQEASYLYAANLKQVRWVVWWQCGDYSKGKGTGPCVMEATATFEQCELEKNWENVLAFKARLESSRQVSSSHATVEVTK